MNLAAILHDPFWQGSQAGPTVPRALDDTGAALRVMSPKNVRNLHGLLVRKDLPVSP